MNKKAFELAISTIILLVIGVAVLIAIILAVTGGFDKFKTTISPLLETAEGSAIRQSCQLACQENNRFNFCCTTREINNEEIKCSDSRLEINCNFNCDNFNCQGSQALLITAEECGAMEGYIVRNLGGKDTNELCNPFIFYKYIGKYPATEAVELPICCLPNDITETECQAQGGTFYSPKCPSDKQSLGRVVSQPFSSEGFVADGVVGGCCK